MLGLILALSLLLGPTMQEVDPPWYAASELPARGQATFYAPGVMRWVYEHRLRLGQVPVCDPPACVGYVAMLRPGDLGRLVWLKPAGQPAEGPFLVVDYAASKDFERLQARGLLVEVDHETARRWDMELPLPDVVVMDRSPYTERLNLPLVTIGGSSPGAEPKSREHRSSSRLWLPVILNHSP